MNYKHIFTIAKKEFWSYLNTPTAYIVAVAFLVPSYFLFFRTALLTGEASMRPFFGLLPWFMLLLAPALTMRSLAEEKRQGTFDLVVAHPVKESELVVGKFLGSWGFTAVLLALTGSIPISMGHFANLDTGQIWAQYVGAWLMIGGFIAVGIWVSAWVNNVVSSFLASAAVCFAWLIAGVELVTLSLPYPLNTIVTELSVMSHVNQFSRGVISLRDVIYFLVVIGVVLSLATIRLMDAKLVEDSAKRSKAYLGAGLIAGIGIMAHLILSDYPLRWDLTSGGLYTLSEATTETLSQVPDVVTMTLYTSEELPAPVQVQKRFVEDVLTDYVRFGDGMVRLSKVNPGSSPELSQQAAESGIRQIQFNTLSNNRYQVESGYLGLTVSYGDQEEVIGYIGDPSNLEYELTRRIRKLIREGDRKIAVLTGLGEKSQIADYGQLAGLLETGYQLTPVSLQNEEINLSEYTGILVVGPTDTLEATSSGRLAITQYLREGGNGVFLLDQVTPDYQLGVANQIDTGWSTLLEDVYGISIENSIAYDVRQNQQIRVGNDFLGYLVNYPFWVNAVPNTDFGPIATINSVTLGWPSPVQVTEQEGVTVTTLLRTTSSGGIVPATSPITPENAPQNGEEQITLGVAAELETGGRAMVIGDADIGLDSFTQFREGNVAFLSNMIDWTMTEAGTKTVPRKNFDPPVLNFTNDSQATNWQYGNLIGIPVLVAVVGIFYLRRRNRLTLRSYSPTHSVS